MMHENVKLEPLPLTDLLIENARIMIGTPEHRSSAFAASRKDRFVDSLMAIEKRLRHYPFASPYDAALLEAIG